MSRVSEVLYKTGIPAVAVGVIAAIATGSLYERNENKAADARIAATHAQITDALHGADLDADPSTFITDNERDEKYYFDRDARRRAIYHGTITLTLPSCVLTDVRLDLEVDESEYHDPELSVNGFYYEGFPFTDKRDLYSRFDVLSGDGKFPTDDEVCDMLGVPLNG